MQPGIPIWADFHMQDGSLLWKSRMYGIRVFRAIAPYRVQLRVTALKGASAEHIS
jgi:hypothetical protein